MGKVVSILNTRKKSKRNDQVEIDRDEVVCGVTIGDILDWCKSNEYDVDQEIVPFLDIRKEKHQWSIKDNIKFSLDKKGTIGCAIQSAIGTPKAQLERYAHVNKQNRRTTNG